MSFQILDRASKHLARSVALILIAGFGAGCSADVARFQDGFYTGAISPRNSGGYASAAQQPYPSQPASVDGSYTGSVNRGAIQPVDLGNSSVQRGDLAPLSAPPQMRQTTIATPRPEAPVAGGSYGTRSASTYPQNTQSYPPRPTAVTSQPALAPVSTSERFAGRTVEPRPAPEPVKTRAERVASVEPVRPADRVPEPKHGPAKNKAILPQVPQVRERQSSASEAGAAPTAKATTPPVAGGSYTVQSGDSLYAISHRTGVSVEAIKKANGMKDGSLRIGQSLAIPSASNPSAPVVAATKPASAPARVDPVVTATPQPQQPAKVASKDSAKPSGYTPPQAESTVIAKAEDDGSAAPSASGISQMRWPVRGRVLTSYGERGTSGRNDGIDIMVPEGTPVKAAENGVVIYAGNGLKEFGNTVLLRHEDGLVTVYGHVSSIAVKRGDQVHRGQEIARSGMTGDAKVPELHFEVRKNAQPVDPVQYLERSAG